MSLVTLFRLGQALVLLGVLNGVLQGVVFGQWWLLLVAVIVAACAIPGLELMIRRERGRPSGH